MTHDSYAPFGRQVHASMARAIQPFHALEDGDVLFAVSTNEVESDPVLDTTALGIVASELAWDAVLTSSLADPMFDEGMPGEDPNKGWNRASVQYRSRRPYRPAVKADDLVMPNGFGNLRMLGTCVAMAGIMTLLYVWIPLIFLNVFVPLGGVTYAAALGGALLGLTTFLYVAGTRETRRDRELATRL